jgi:hypothetical protein
MPAELTGLQSALPRFLCAGTMAQVNGQVPFNQMPQPSQTIQSLLDAARVRPPSGLAGKEGQRVH